MKIKIDYIKTPVKEIKVKRTKAEAGSMGGKAKVPKGFAKMDKERLRELSKKAIEKRWNNK